MATVSIDTRDLRAVKRALRFELSRYERSVKYYREGAGSSSAKAEDNAHFAEERITELKDCLDSLEDAS